MVRGLRLEGGQLLLEGYPAGASVHGINLPGALELKRIAVFLGELQVVERWLSLIPTSAPDDTSDETFVYLGLADAALMGLCRCFDSDHPLKPLKRKFLSLSQRDDLERLQNIRNKLVAHNEQLGNGVFSLIIRAPDLTAIEAVSLNLFTPFAALAEIEKLRALSRFVLDWVRQEHGRIASEIVEAFNALPAIVRAVAPPFTIDVVSKDHFAPKSQRGRDGSTKL